jgi:hypothetical protein
MKALSGLLSFSGSHKQRSLTPKAAEALVGPEARRFSALEAPRGIPGSLMAAG